MKAGTHSLSLPQGALASPAERIGRSTHEAEAYDRLTPAQRRLMVGAIAGAHVAALWALLQVREVRDAVAEVAPMFVSIVAPTPPKIEPPPPPPPREIVKPVPTPRVIAAPPSPAPAPFVVAAPPPEPEPVVVVAAPALVAPPAPPAPAPAPRIIPASAVQYLEPLAPEYPKLAKRLGETGRVVIRVFIDEAGLSRQTQVNRSSGHSRLDDAALAAVQKARFKPYTENGQAVSGWAFIPIDFELER